MILREADKKDYKKVKKLYLSAFPPEERPPFYLMLRRLKQGRAKLYIACENSEFIGFTYLIQQRDVIYLFYFAIEDKYRGLGYGSAVLKKLIEQNEDKRIFLAREQLDECAENYDERVRRRKFYLKNGFSDTNCRMQEASVIYDVMCSGGKITAGEYDEMMTLWAGKLVRMFVKMRIID